MNITEEEGADQAGIARSFGRNFGAAHVKWPAMISVILIANESDAAAVETLSALVEAVAEGVLRDAILVGPPSAQLDRVADAAGAARIAMTGARNAMLKHAAISAKSDWLLIIHAGCVPQGAWINALAEFPAQVERDDDAGFLPLVTRRGIGAMLKAAFANGKARITGRADPRHGLLVRKSTVIDGGRMRLVALEGGLVDRRR